MLCKYGMWMVCGSNTPPGEGANSTLASWRSANSNSETWKCQINTFKNSSYSPFEIRICWKKVSTSSSSVSMSFIFLAIMDTLPLRQTQLSLGSSPCHYWLDLSTNSRSLGWKRLQIEFKIVLLHSEDCANLLHIQTLCNSAICPKNCANCSILH